VPFLLGLAGLGAVIMTRFGTQSVSVLAAVETSALAPVLPVTSEPESPAIEPVAPTRKPRPDK